MDLILRIGVALIGALLLRGYLYPAGWRRRTYSGALMAIIGAMLLFPLASRGMTGLAATAILLSLALLPYRRLAVAYLTARARMGLRQLAERWEGELEEDPDSGQWQVVATAGETRRWAGNVLVHEGAIDPAVRRRQVRYMMAFVIELESPPRFLCSLVLGWNRPRYFEREWRRTHVVRGEHLAADFSQLGIENPTGRATGGDLRHLSRLEGPPEELPTEVGVWTSDTAEFLRTFDPELCQRFSRVSAQSYPYEVNLTPSSVNIYTTYCGGAEQVGNAALLETLAERMRA